MSGGVPGFGFCSGGEDINDEAGRSNKATTSSSPRAKAVEAVDRPQSDSGGSLILHIA